MGEDYTYQGGSGRPFTAHPDYPTRITRPSAFYLFFIPPQSSLNVSGKKAAFNHPGPVCQQVVSAHKSSYAHIRFPPQQGRFLWGLVPLSLTQIGNVTHLWETGGREKKTKKTGSGAAELAVMPPAARPRRKQDQADDFDTEGE